LWQFATTITFDDPNNHVVAESSGEFFVESDLDALIGAGTGSAEGGGKARCEVDDLVEWPPYTVVAEYQVMITGGVTARPEGGPWNIEFAPMGFGISSDMTYPSTFECVLAPDLPQRIPGILRHFSPGAGASLDGFSPARFDTTINPNGAAVTFEEPLTGLPGATIKVEIWKPQP